MTSHDSRTRPAADILVVDDEIGSRRLLTDILSREGYQVRPASAPQVALESALAHPPSLILLDVRMPEMDGFEVCQRLKQEERTCDVPVVFVSALQDVQDRVQGFEVGGVDFVSKPIEAAEVLARVKTHLQLRRLQLHLEQRVAERTAELAQANETLLESEARYRSVVQDTPVMLCASKHAGEIEFANQAYCDYFDKQIEELVGSSFLEMIPEGDRERVSADIAALTPEAPVRSHEHRVIAPDGRIRWQRWTNRAIFDEKGQVLTYQAFGEDITERKRAEEQYRTFFTENVSPVFWAEMKEPIPVDLPTEEQVDAIFRQAYVKDVSDATARMYGLTREELLGEMIAPWSAAGYQDRNSALHQYYQRFVRSGYDTHSSEIRERTEDGRDVWLLMSIKGIVEDGHLVRIWGSQIDITQRVKAESALRKSQRLLSLVIDNVPALVAYVDKRERYRFVNERYEQVYGLPRTQLPGKHVQEILGPDGYAAAKPHIAATLAGEAVSYEDVFHYPDTGPRWLSIDYVPDRDHVGEVQGFVGMIRDITERRHVEAELRKGKERLEEAQRIAQIGDWEYDLLAGEITWSEEMYRIFDVEPQSYEPGAKAEEEFYHPEDLPALRRAFEDLFSAAADLDIEYRIVTRQGKVKACRSRGRLILDDQGIPSHARGTTEDITERKLVEHQIMEYQQRLKALASQLTLSEERERRRIARDLHDEVGQTLAFARTGLASARKATSDARREAILDDVSHSLRQAIRDTRDLIFDLSSPLMSEFGLGAALGEWLENQVGKKHDLQIDFIHDGRRFPLDDDTRAILFRCTRELLTNVVKHAQAKRVTVRLEGEGTLARIVVQDDGIGFDTDAIPEATDRGAGFGLFSIRERMADLNGSLEIQSEPGQGCRVVLTAPVLTSRASRE